MIVYITPLYNEYMEDQSEEVRTFFFGDIILNNVNKGMLFFKETFGSLIDGDIRIISQHYSDVREEYEATR